MIRTDPDSCRHCIDWYGWRIMLLRAAFIHSHFAELKYVYYWQRMEGERP